MMVYYVKMELRFRTRHFCKRIVKKYDVIININERYTLLYLPVDVVTLEYCKNILKEYKILSIPQPFHFRQVILIKS